jgi:hypothetical protein
MKEKLSYYYHSFDFTEIFGFLRILWLAYTGNLRLEVLDCGRRLPTRTHGVATHRLPQFTCKVPSLMLLKCYTSNLDQHNF